MINLEYHKGRPCPRKEITCQEGYCSGCVIYLNKSSLIRPFTSKHTNLQFDKRLRELREVPAR